MEYFTLYHLILRNTAKGNVKKAQTLLDELSKEKFVKDKLQLKSVSTYALVNQTLEVLNNLIDEGKIKGSYRATKQGNIYLLNGLTTVGYKELKTLENNTTRNKILGYIEKEGIPTNVNGISKVIAHFFQKN
ncbi:hypothetical protein [Liquorilactobacillus oeni]|uniref:YjcQ protein n=1 Tax=Liquorilactobacillus oeni DSM 19972 TaxID=1423777 RepID=A0A0R1MF37_9LACO|nr:hypothetical protein [Liquorilactobacillus oeni]KRL06620.1 hypothetical protein FD46_GL000292 [Liquorilactobacillus oeni DSM 19972]